MTERLRRSRLDSLDRFIVGVVWVALAGTIVVVALERQQWSRPTNWPAVAIFSCLLIVGELQSIAWLRLKDAGEVTPGWAFGFALLLLGSPSLAMAAMAVASSLPDLLHRKGLRRTAFNAAQTILSLVGGALVLTISGFGAPLSVHSSFTPGLLAAIMVAAIVIYVTNGVLTCVAIALNLGVSIGSVVRQATQLAVSADAALLVLAPIFVITADFSLFTVPLIALIAFLVYNSSREALERDHRAGHDHLTNLLNAPAFHEHVNGYIAASNDGSSMGCVLLLDIDGFKSLNDRLGHHIGDEVLRRVGALLDFHHSHGAVAARLGGDEFAVFFPDVAEAPHAISYARDLGQRLSAPLSVKGFPISISASIGAAVIDRAIGSSEDVLRHADLAMYRAKRNRTGVELYATQPSGEHTGGRISLLADLVHAFDRDELWLAYQPQVNARTGKVEAFEALLRWDHPTLGTVQPDEFIALSEQTDLIDDITERVLQLACRDSVHLMAASPDVRIAINVSTRNLRHRQFPSLVERVLAEHGVSPSALEIEVTESAFAFQQEVAADVIVALRTLGVGLSMDDFGSGYSSFSRLLHTPVDSLKIDQALVQNMTNDDRNFLVIRTIIDLSSALGLRSIAEGAENVETINQLRALGCDLVQGFVIARPMKVVDAVRWLHEHPTGVPLELEAVS